MKSKRTSRRAFVQSVGKGMAGLGISSSLFDLFANQLFNKAFAEVTNLTPAEIYYIHLSFAGGAPRWNFDLPLKPQNNSLFVPGMFGTHIVRGTSGYDVEYSARTHRISATETINLPPVWFTGPNGKDFRTLLNSMLMVRGVDMEISSHPISNARQTATNVGGYSITGVAADVAGRAIPAVIDREGSASEVFRSARGLAAITYSGNSPNPAAEILFPFRPLPPTAAFLSDDWTEIQAQALTKFEEYAVNSQVSSNSLQDAYESARQLMRENTYGLNREYPPLLAKYLALVNEALLPRMGELIEIFPNVITVNSTSKYFSLDENIAYTNGMNLWETLSLPKLSPRNMAANFALAELLINRGLTSSIALALPGFVNVNSGSGAVSIGHDQHFTGKITSTFLNTLFFRALLNCLLEFKEKLGPKFDKSIIHLSSEWNRSPKKDGSGSNHGVNGSNVTLLSGMIQKLDVIGNVRSAGEADYPGTWGVAAPWNNGTEVRPIVVSDVTRTITSMLGLKDIVNNGSSLMIPDTSKPGKWKPKRTGATNV